MPKRTCPPNPLSVLLYLRTSRSLTLGQLGKICCISPNVLCQAELRNASMGIASLRRLADFFGVTLDALAKNDFSVIATLPPVTCVRTNAARKRLQANREKMEKIGDMGEDFVAALEREKLKGTPYEDKVNTALADDLKAVCDMMSFDPVTLQPILLEVKSTSGEEDEELHFSTEELEFLKHCAANGSPYKLYRVFHVGRKGGPGYRVYTAKEVLKRFDLEPSAYIARPKKDMEV